MSCLAEEPSLQPQARSRSKKQGKVVNNVHVRPHQLIAPFVSVPAVFLSSIFRTRHANKLPWSVQDLEACFVIRDHDRDPYQRTPGRRSIERP
jgi:hypothetical protein